jgi:hypothetical protein
MLAGYALVLVLVRGSSGRRHAGTGLRDQDAGAST